MNLFETTWKRLLAALALLALTNSGWAAKLDGASADLLLLPALYRGDAKAASLALDAGANANARNSDGTTALIMSVLHADLDTTRKLIEHGADVNARSGKGRTALIAAASVPGRWETVRLLLDNGADPNVVSTAKPGAVPGLYADGETPLTESAKSLDTRTLELLLDRGANPAVADNTGTTPLHNAALYGNRDGVRLLLARKVPLSGKNMLGMTPLIDAAVRNDAAIVRMLLDAGAEANETDRLGSTPLMWAAFNEKGDPALVDLLLRAGANPAVKNKPGETALIWAQRNGETAIVDRLRKAGATAETAARADVPPPREGLSIDEAITRAVEVLQKASPEFSKVSGCVSCHHQTLPGTVANIAKSRGLAVNEELMARDVKRVIGFIRPFRAGLIENADVVPDIQVTGGYFAWYLRMLDQQSEPALEAMARSVALHQQTDGHWIGWAPRPPLEFGDIQATALSIRTLQMYPAEGRQAEYTHRIAKAAVLLENAVPGSDHERVYQLIGLTWAGARRSVVQRVAAQVLAAQRPDGGWAQLRTLDSDAYATGQALYALKEAGVLDGASAAYQRGVWFLLATQFEDGSWHVKTRAFPFQPLNDTKFPPGRDQWISATATSWAAMALASSSAPAQEARLRH